MALKLVDRLLTVAVTATITSAAWIVALSGVEREREAPPASPPALITESDPSPVVAGVPPSAAAPWIVPVAGISPAELVDTFDDARGGGAREHEALDIAAPAGTAVIAAAPGKVEKLFLSDDGGKTIYVRSPDGRTISYYAHLRDYEPGLREGAVVERGQKLGTVGSTGNADPASPHLHFAIYRSTPEEDWWDASAPVNPYPLLRGRATAGN